jgi:hypothetical protein
MVPSAPASNNLSTTHQVEFGFGEIAHISFLPIALRPYSAWGQAASMSARASWQVGQHRRALPLVRRQPAVCSGTHGRADLRAK